MGLIKLAGDMTYIITGKDKFGNTIITKSWEGEGTVTGSYWVVEPVIKELEKQYPGLEWEWEAYKD